MNFFISVQKQRNRAITPIVKKIPLRYAGHISKKSLKMLFFNVLSHVMQLATLNYSLPTLRSSVDRVVVLLKGFMVAHPNSFT